MIFGWGVWENIGLNQHSIFREGACVIREILPVLRGLEIKKYNSYKSYVTSGPDNFILCVAQRYFKYLQNK